MLTKIVISLILNHHSDLYLLALLKDGDKVKWQAKTYKAEVFQPRSFNEHNYLIPIPQSEIESNAKLEQNPGY
jgi:hypothetical protein